MIGMMEGVIDPQDVERAGLSLIDEPAEVVEMMDQPEARNRERHGSVLARRLEPGEEGAIEGPLAWAEVAGDEIARPTPWVSPAF